MEHDAELLERFQRGDQTACETLVARYREPLYRLAYRWLHDQEEALDVTQQALVQAFLHLEQFQRRSSFKTWLYQILLNQCKNRRRSAGRVRFEPLSEALSAPQEDGLTSAIRMEEALRLRRAIDSLPDAQRITVLLRIYEELPFDAIASILQCSIGTAKANFHHAFEKLKAWCRAEQTP